MIKSIIHIILAAIIALITLSVSMSYHYCFQHSHIHLASNCGDEPEPAEACDLHSVHDCCGIQHNSETEIAKNNAVAVLVDGVTISTIVEAQHCCRSFFISNALFKEWKPFTLINWKLMAQGIVKKLDLPVVNVIFFKNTSLIKQAFLFVPPKISNTCSIVMLHNQLLFYY